MEARGQEREECASPCTCASGETSEAPLLPEPRGLAPRSLLLADAAALEEGRHGVPLRARGPEGDGRRRGVFAAAGILAVIGLVLLGAAACSPAGLPDRTSERTHHESQDVVGLNVIGVRPTTPALPAELPPQAPLRPPPDFPIEPPPGFYPHLRAAAGEKEEGEEELAPPRPPPNFPIEPPPGFYPDLPAGGEAAELAEPLEEIPAEDVPLETGGPAHQNPLLRSARAARPEGELRSMPAGLLEPSAVSPPTGGSQDSLGGPAPSRRIEDVRAADPSLLSLRLAGQAA